MDTLRRAFRDIAAGHTHSAILGRPAFIRHLSYSDQVDFDATRDQFFNTAKSDGLDTDETRLAYLKKTGEWSDAKERELETARVYVLELEEGKRKHANMPSMVKSLLKQIEDAKKEYETKVMERRRLLGLTCEVYADRELSDHSIVTSLYKDPTLTAPLFDATEFDYFSDQTVNQIVADYNTAVEGCSEKNVKRLAMQPFFQRYFQLAGDDLAAFFGRPICALTFFQCDLLRWGSHFKHIYGTHDVSVFPKNVLEDPDLLTDYATAAAKGKETMAQQGAFEEGAIVMGMKKEDAKAIGIQQVNPMDAITKQFGGNVMEWAASRQG